VDGVRRDKARQNKSVKEKGRKNEFDVRRNGSRKLRLRSKVGGKKGFSRKRKKELAQKFEKTTRKEDEASTLGLFVEKSEDLTYD